MKSILIRLLYAGVILIVSAAFVFKVFQPIQVLPRIRLAPGFSLIDQDGQRLTNEDLRGKIVLYAFTYTRCPSPCYEIETTMQEILQRQHEVQLGEVPLVLVTISFDPRHDTPAVLKAHARSLSVDSEKWIFATGSDESLLKTIIGAGFEVYYQQKEDGTFTFDPAFILVDGWGIIRGEYRYTTEVPTADRILRHLAVLADEINYSKGSARLAYETAHLFLCYPR